MNNIARLFGIFIILLPSINFAHTPIVTHAWTTQTVFAQPESVVYDPKRRQLYVSNVNGDPSEPDGNGYISRLSPTGQVISLYWVDGLDAPKGMAIFGDTLYVADINQLVAIDIGRGQVIQRYLAPEAKFLNDVAVDKQGNVYVSGFLTNSIYRLSDDKFTLWLSKDELDSPNGLLIENGQLIVASWGTMTDGFATDIPGHLKTVNIKSKKIKSLGYKMPVGNLDGLTSDGDGNYFVTDWMQGKLLHIKPNGTSKTLLNLTQGSADHTTLGNLIIIPMMMSNHLTAYQIR